METHRRHLLRSAGSCYLSFTGTRYLLLRRDALTDLELGDNLWTAAGELIECAGWLDRFGAQRTSTMVAECLEGAVSGCSKEDETRPFCSCG
jgi:hypothetical protein